MAVLKTQQVECEMDHGEFWFAHLSTVNCSLSAELDEVLYSSEILSGYSSLRHYETIFVDLGKKSVGCDLPSLCFIVCLICCLISSCQGFYNLLDSLQYEFDFNLHQPFRTLCIWNALFLGSYFGHLSLSGSIILLCQENLLRLFLFFLHFFGAVPGGLVRGDFAPRFIYWSEDLVCPSLTWRFPLLSQIFLPRRPGESWPFWAFELSLKQS